MATGRATWRSPGGGGLQQSCRDASVGPETWMLCHVSTSPCSGNVTTACVHGCVHVPAHARSCALTHRRGGHKGGRGGGKQTELGHDFATRTKCFDYGTRPPSGMVL